MLFNLRSVRTLSAVGALALACLSSGVRGQCVGYSVASGGPGTFTPGTQDLGLYADDGTTGVTFPFNVNLYGTSFGSATVSSNGTLQFTTNSPAYINGCLPSATFTGPTILPFWDDLYTASQANGLGIFTETVGSAPNRQFVIEWRTTYCCTAGAPLNDFEIKFYEGQNFFDVIYSTPLSDRCSATIGVQDGAGTSTQFSCNTAGGTGCAGAPTSGLSLRFGCVTSATAGACCSPATGTCNIGTAATCSGAGNFQGLGTSCPAGCPQPGACCNTSTGVCSQTGVSGCVSPSTFSGPGTSCTPNPCIGACCNPTTGLCISTTTSGCAAPSTFQGLGLVCNPNPCPQPPPPANDECTAAVALTLNNSVQGTLANATGTDITVCSGSNLDVWYRFTAPSANSYGITATVAGAGFVPAIAIFASTPCPVIPDSNDPAPDGCQAQGGTGFVKRVGMAQGESILIRVGDFGDRTVFNIVVATVQAGACCDTTTATCTSSNTGAAGCAAGTTYQGDNTSCLASPCPQEACCDPLSGFCTVAAPGACAAGSTGQGPGSSCTVNPCPQPPPPANDNCANAIALCDGIPVNGATVAATVDGTASCGAAAASPDVWYSYTPTVGGSVAFSTCGSNMDTVLTAFDACAGNEIVCLDDFCGLQTTINVTINAGATTLIRVAGFAGTTGSFTLTASGGGGTCAGTGGVCCRGATCSTTVTSAAACTGSLIPGQTAGAVFASTATVCNTIGNNTSPCCYANFNKTGGITVQDIFDFLNDWFASSPYARTGGNGGSGSLAVQNIFDFLNAWFAGGCS